MAVLASTLAAGIFGGCISVLVDADHIIAHKLGKKDRFLHKYYLLAAGIIICGCLAYCGRLYIK